MTSPIEKLHNLPRRERRAAARAAYNQAKPWNLPDFDHLSRSAARKAAWVFWWSQYRTENLKATIATPAHTQYKREQHEKAVRSPDYNPAGIFGRLKKWWNG